VISKVEVEYRLGQVAGIEVGEKGLVKEFLPKLGFVKPGRNGLRY
jgi:hypothetical protein